MIFQDYDGQWYPGMDGGLSFTDIYLTVEEKLRGNLNQENWPDQSGPAKKWEETILALDHSGGLVRIYYTYYNMGSTAFMYIIKS